MRQDQQGAAVTFIRPCNQLQDAADSGSQLSAGVRPGPKP